MENYVLKEVMMDAKWEVSTTKELAKTTVRVRDDKLAEGLTSDMEREILRYLVVQNQKL